MIRVEAAPINPSDLISLLGSANPAEARQGGGRTVLPLAAKAAKARIGRRGMPLTVGPEGAGTVVRRRSKGEHLVGTLRNWYMPATMARVGQERATELQRRVIDDIATTFASHFSHEISLAQALDPLVMQAYGQMASGQKYLINPTL